MTNDKPVIRFRDVRCTQCGRMLQRANFDSVVLTMPTDLMKTYPLFFTALKSLSAEMRCPKCGHTNIYKPFNYEGGNGHIQPVPLLLEELHKP